MLYTRVGLELTIERGFKSTIGYIHSTIKYARRKVLYLLDVNCEDECNSRWCSVADCRSLPSSFPNRFSLPEMVDEEEDDDDDVGGHGGHRPRTGDAHAASEALETPTHRKACWDVEREETQCLNGGSCFAVELHNGMRRSGCSCPPGWTGERCEMRYIDPSLWADNYDDSSSYRSASISVEIGLLIVVSFVLITIGSLLFRHQRRRFLISISTGNDVKSNVRHVIPTDCLIVSLDDDCVFPFNVNPSNTLRRQEVTTPSPTVYGNLLLDSEIALPLPVCQSLPVSLTLPFKKKTSAFEALPVSKKLSLRSPIVDKVTSQ